MPRDRRDVADRHRALLVLLDELFVAMDGVHDDAAARLGLHRSDLAALTVLAESDEPLPIGRIGERLGLGRPAMTALVDRLAEDGHVRRLADPDDGRRVLVELSPAAAKLGRTVLREVGDRVRAALADVAPDHLAAAEAVLGRLPAAIRGDG